MQWLESWAVFPHLSVINVSCTHFDAGLCQEGLSCQPQNNTGASQMDFLLSNHKGPRESPTYVTICAGQAGCKESRLKS